VHADRDLDAALFQDHAENAPRVGAERHAHAELLRPLADGERHDAVDADGGEGHRDNAEDPEHRGDDAALSDEGVELRARVPT
jgi:hypothetical protein